MKLIPTMIFACLFALTGMPLPSSSAFGDEIIGDHSANAPGGFAAFIEGTQGVVLKVPINDRGEEYATEASVRLDRNLNPPNSSEAIPVLWMHGSIIPAIPTVTDGKISDSSTCAFFGWAPAGWVAPYHFASYRPGFYFAANNSYTGFTSPSFRFTAAPSFTYTATTPSWVSPFYGFRYYYYRWR